MGVADQEAIEQFRALMDQLDEPLKNTFQNMHQGCPSEALERFLKAREWNVVKAHKMLVDCLQWRIQNEIDNILAKPIIPADLYRAIRDSQLVGLSGCTKEGLPVIAFGVGLSTFDKASLLTDISTIDDLNYPKKTQTYYIVNAPYVFSACWKVVKPLLRERTRRKIQVLQGCGRDELLKIMDYTSLPHFFRKEGSVSCHHIGNVTTDNCFSLDHDFHRLVYNYIQQQAALLEAVSPIKQGSVMGIPVPDPEDANVAKTIKSRFQKFGGLTGLSNSLNGLEVNGR
ncbi:hypothetical protein MANES_15G069701v8 [Manihot esculenta]|uniref:Uncharacterized protein n=1 Tax=Manihot esculenta TaxID=3983 RepID=A0ACC8CFF2_MANES|nr:hypothetical protein MANES_15G069701v8 [Manihot esculenta]